MLRYAFGLALFSLAGAAFAAEPAAGTWKLNAGKTKYSAGQPPQSQTVTIVEKGEQMEVTINAVAADGKPVQARYTVPVAGGAGTVIESPAYDAVTSKRVNERTREITYSKAGKQTLTIRTVVSPDGKTMRVRVKGTDALGKPTDGVLLLERQ